MEKEIIKFKGTGGPIIRMDLIHVQAIINSRVRHHGKTTKEIMLRQESMDNKPMEVDDLEIANKVTGLRKENHAAMKDHHLRRGKKEVVSHDYKVGDQVLIRDTLSKHQPREVHAVVEVDQNSNIRVKSLKTS